jgi:hypothetical protein
MAWVLDKRKQANDQKIAAFGSSYMGTPVGAAEGCDLLIFKIKKPRHMDRAFQIAAAF